MVGNTCHPSGDEAPRGSPGRGAASSRTETTGRVIIWRLAAVRRKASAGLGLTTSIKNRAVVRPRCRWLLQASSTKSVRCDAETRQPTRRRAKTIDDERDVLCEAHTPDGGCQYRWACGSSGSCWSPFQFRRPTGQVRASLRSEEPTLMMSVCDCCLSECLLET